MWLWIRRSRIYNNWVLGKVRQLPARREEHRASHTHKYTVLAWILWGARSNGTLEGQEGRDMEVRLSSPFSKLLLPTQFGENDNRGNPHYGPSLSPFLLPRYNWFFQGMCTLPRHVGIILLSIVCVGGGVVFVCVCVQLLQSCPTLCDPMDCSPPGSSVQGIFQARILEWMAISSSRGSSWPRDQTQVSCISCIGRQILYHCVT